MTATDHTTYVPMGVAAKMIPMHVRDVQRWIQQGVITPTKDAKGWHQFSPGDIARMRVIRSYTQRRLPMELIIRLIDIDAPLAAAFQALADATIVSDGKGSTVLIIPVGYDGKTFRATWVTGELGAVELKSATVRVRAKK